MGFLDGRVAIVTGAGSGIGRAEALRLAHHGAAVLVNDWSPAGGTSSADAVVAEIIGAGGRAVACRADVSEWATGTLLVERAVGDLGRLDIVVANAGVVHREAVVEVTEAHLGAQVGVMLTGTFSIAHYAARHWRSDAGSGRPIQRRLVLTSSSAGVPGGVRDFSVYGAVKAGVAALAMSAALELRPLGATVNAILPHAATLMDAEARGAPPPPHFEAGDPDPGNPEHVANVVAYLASERAGWLSGQVLEIAGTSVRRWLPWSPGPEVHQATPWDVEALDEAIASSIYGTLPHGRVVPEATAP